MVSFCRKSDFPFPMISANSCMNPVDKESDFQALMSMKKLPLQHRGTSKVVENKIPRLVWKDRDELSAIGANNRDPQVQARSRAPKHSVTVQTQSAHGQRYRNKFASCWLGLKLVQYQNTKTIAYGISPATNISGK